MNLTDEQIYAVDLAKIGSRLKIEAFAGSGKTTTLRAIGHNLASKNGLYLAFNRSIAKEAALKFPGNVLCKTAHSLAWSIGRRYQDRLSGRLTPSLIQAEIKLPHDHSAMAQAAMQVVARFCQSDAEEINESLLTAEDLLSLAELNLNIGTLSANLVESAKKLWDELVDVNCKLPISHDVYLKKWILTRPSLPYDFVLFDEAQDANPAILDLLLRQRNAQIVFVGDRYQQIYSWRGAVNAMSKFECDKVAYLTQSFRFGDAIAEAANFVLRDILGCPREIKGNPSIKSQIERNSRPRAVICRTNLEAVHWLIRANRVSSRVAMVGGTFELQSLIKGIEGLKMGRPLMCPELVGFDSYSELVAYSQTDSGASFATVLRLIREQGTFSLLRILEKVGRNEESSSEILVTTAHKSKGREWDSVLLANDFRGPESELFSSEDGNLLYVALTRAIHSLDVSRCSFVKLRKNESALVRSANGMGYRRIDLLEK